MPNVASGQLGSGGNTPTNYTCLLAATAAFVGTLLPWMGLGKESANALDLGSFDPRPLVVFGVAIFAVVLASLAAIPALGKAKKAMAIGLLTCGVAIAVLTLSLGFRPLGPDGPNVMSFVEVGFWFSLTGGAIVGSTGGRMIGEA